MPSMGWPRASTTRPRKASPTGIPAVFPLRRTLSPARISWLLPKSTQPTLVAPQVLHHALDAAGEEQDLAVADVLQSADGGDLIPHGEDGAGLLGRSGGVPGLNGLPDQGDDALPAGVQVPELLLELPQAALQAPVVDILPHLQTEAALEALIPDPFQGGGAVALVQEGPELLPLLRAGLRAAPEGGGHLRTHPRPPPSLPAPGTGRRPRCPRTAPASPPRRRPIPSPGAGSLP